MASSDQTISDFEMLSNNDLIRLSKSGFLTCHNSREMYFEYNCLALSFARFDGFLDTFLRCFHIKCNFYTNSTIKIVSVVILFDVICDLLSPLHHLGSSYTVACRPLIVARGLDCGFGSNGIKNIQSRFLER